MAMPHALYLAEQNPLDFTTPPQEPAPAKRAGLSLVDRLDEVELIASTLEALDEGELAPELQAELEAELFAAIHGTKEKIDRTAGVLAAFEAAAAAARAEVERLEKRAAAFDRNHARLSSYVLGILQQLDGGKLDGHTASLARKLNPPSVAIDDAAAIPAEFKRTPPPPAPVPDKTAIKAALKLDANAVPGARLAQTARLVRS
jgi:Siphovirus Gp157